jgi:hypothetical protein
VRARPEGGNLGSLGGNRIAQYDTGIALQPLQPEAFEWRSDGHPVKTRFVEIENLD